MLGMTEETEFSKDLIATQTRNAKTVTITLTAIEVFAVVNAVEFAVSLNPKSSLLGKCAKDAAKKMYDCLDPNSLLSQHLKKIWGGDVSYNFSSGNLPHESSPLEGFES
jgi:hypothetical protein